MCLQLKLSSSVEKVYSRMLFKKKKGKKTHLCIFKNAGSLNKKGLKYQITFSSIQSAIIGFSVLQEK